MTGTLGTVPKVPKVSIVPSGSEVCKKLRENAL
jgi:hypothetical protein